MVVLDIGAEEKGLSFSNILIVAFAVCLGNRYGLVGMFMFVFSDVLLW